MRNFKNRDNRFDFDGEDEEERDGNVEINIEADLIGAMEVELAEIQLNQELLDRAMEVARQDWFWFFRSPIVKVRRIDTNLTFTVTLAGG